MLYFSTGQGQACFRYVLMCTIQCDSWTHT
uniref:Uncharacterized protein n=1 Tax=Arundo donax TaxID=35708 RepID=A0A0A9AWZ7_ARUDO